MKIIKPEIQFSCIFFIQITLNQDYDVEITLGRTQAPYSKC